ncbi:RRP15-like protein [Leptidea sinapis]|uniref:RRP15-like protein n=1 Tax=Leptidea sinapis TaxID=189913 RepID=UPI00212EE6C4|nr:RRP15-like protein [Leptidea sinapis]
MVVTVSKTMANDLDSDSDLSSADEINDSDDVSKENKESGSENDDETLIKNEGWADSLAKILSSNKPKNKKTLVLSRAKKHSEIIKKAKEEKPSFEVVGESVAETKPDISTVDSNEAEQPPAKKKRHEKSSARIKPNILEKDRERLLSKIATKGVVQLFNAVRNQQKTFEKELRNEVSETRKEKVFKKFDKRSFLDSLMGQSKSIIVDENASGIKDELKSEDQPKWNVLRDDFMMGAKMKDWDKEVVEE